MQNRMDLSAQDLELVLILFRKKTLTGAAEALGIEQSTLSRQLSALEDRLKRNLFLRHRKGLTPSPTVLDLVPWAEKMEVIVRNANQLTSVHSDDIAGDVHVSCPDAIADFLLAPRLHKLAKEHRGIRLRITSSETLFDLDQLDCDIAIRIGRKPVGDAVVVKLTESKVRAFGRPEFCPPAGEANIDHLPILHRSEPRSADSQAINKIFPNKIFFTANRMTTSIMAAQAGAGVVFLPEAFAAAFSNFVAIPIAGWPEPKVAIYLAAPTTIRRLRHVDVVWCWIREAFESVI